MAEVAKLDLSGIDLKALLPDWSLLTPEKKSALYQHIMGIFEVYTSITPSTADDALVQLAKNLIGPSIVSGTLEPTIKGLMDTAVNPQEKLKLLQSLDLNTLMALAALVQQIISLFAKK